MFRCIPEAAQAARKELQVLLVPSPMKAAVIPARVPKCSRSARRSARDWQGGGGGRRVGGGRPEPRLGSGGLARRRFRRPRRAPARSGVGGGRGGTPAAAGG